MFLSLPSFLEVRIDSVGPNVTLSETPTIHIKEASLDINLLYIANKSNGETKNFKKAS